MKKISLTVAAALLLASSFTTPAAAQHRVLGRANIPFSFTAHGQSFDAGAYELHQLGAQIVRLQEAATGRGVTLLSSQNVSDSGTTKIVFRSFGTRQILAAVVAPSYSISVPRSPAEAQMAASGTKTVMLQSGK